MMCTHSFLSRTTAKHGHHHRTYIHQSIVRATQEGKRTTTNQPTNQASNQPTTIKTEEVSPQHNRRCTHARTHPCYFRTVMVGIVAHFRFIDERTNQPQTQRQALRSRTFIRPRLTRLCFGVPRRFLMTTPPVVRGPINAELKRPFVPQSADTLLPPPPLLLLLLLL